MNKASSDDTIIKKLGEIAAGRSLRLLDLFAGCGGLSLGFQAAGFKITAGVEIDEHAARSHGANFHGGDDRFSKPHDITETSPADLCRTLSLGPVGEAVDVIVGGPPCQAFARVGRAKLREVDEHPEAFLHDPRAQLYKSYLDYVEEFKPIALLMENVPDVLNHGGQNIAEEVSDVLEAKGYVCRYTLLNSVFFGIPQMRERMFLLAYRRELEITKPSFPNPTHCHELPPGYGGSRAVALKLLNGLFGGAHDYLEPEVPNADALSAVTAFEAIGDLPPIFARKELAEGRLRRGARRVDQPTVDYDEIRPVSGYAYTLKTWEGFEAPEEGLYDDQQIRYLPRDYVLFSEMLQGAEYPELYRLAMKRFRDAAIEKGVLEDSREGEILKAEMVPPYDPGKFPNKWWKLRQDWPVRTLMAHLGKDSYSHIHYDREQARTIPVREAARLQSFPDGFKFCGTMNPAFRQTGNSVPPILAREIASRMLLDIRSGVKRALSVSF